MDQNKTEIKSFLCQRLSCDDLDEDANIFELGFVNSLFAMELVLFVEKQFQITIGDDDLRLENFQSINAISNLVERRRPTP